MSGKAIEIRGCRTHHLKDLSLDIPREAFTVVCGVSGSGKSSLVMDTLGAESVRRFLGTLSSEGAESLARPDVDRINGLPPAVSAGFASRASGPRETLATIAEAYDGLRVLFTRAAVPHCPRCGRSVRAVSPEQVLSDLLATPEGTKVVLLAPRGRGPQALVEARRDGFVRARVAGRMVRLDEPGAEGEVGAEDAVEVVVDRLVVRPDARTRFADSVEQGFRTGGGVLRAVVDRPAAKGGQAPAATEVSFADRPFCPDCGLTYPPLSPALFSFHGLAGACPSCLGTGTVLELDPELVWPRESRVSRAMEALVQAAPKVGRAKRRRTLLTWAKAEGLGARDRVGEASAKARAALLDPTDPDGLLADVRAQGRTERFSRPRTCPACEGGRLSPFAAAARLEGHGVRDLLDRTVAEMARALEALTLPGAEGALARPVRDDVVARLRFLEEVGLGHLQPSRAADTLSSGERRRALLAAACAARMSGLLFLLDEPTMGLHPADRGPLRARLRRLVDEGNTVVCVEHDPEVLRAADYVLELGPRAGAEGGRVLDQGPVAEVLARGTCPMAVAANRRPEKPRKAPRHDGPALRVVEATWRNLRGVTAHFPQGALTCVTGVSGAGKSTLVFDVLAPAAQALLARAPLPAGRLKALEGLHDVDRVSVSDGAPPRHARSTPGSVLGVLGPLRDLYAATVEARARGYGPSRFSAHVKGGRCEACQGLGVRTVRLRQLPGLAAPCDVCGGSRFRPETLAIRVKGMSIADTLALPLSRAAEVFRDLRGVGGPAKAAADVGLGYVPLGEPTERLSGGEALRLRLAAALGRAGRTRTIYLLDEPCAGLHPADVAHLASVLLRLAAEGNTVVAVDHHPDLVRQADHVVDLGPGPGTEGGRLVVEGPPATVAACRASRTGASLR